MPIDVSIKGIQEAQKANLHHINSLRPNGDLAAAVKWGVSAAHRAAIPATPWDTTALRNSHRIDLEGNGERAFVHIDGSAVNPRGQKPSIYGPHLHRQGLKPGRKGGIRAFYEYVVDRYGRSIGDGMARFFLGRFRSK